MATSNDDVVDFGDENAASVKRNFKHPVAVFFHLAFRVLALLAYLFSNWITANFIVGFLVILLFLSLDFWTVKNVTGRLLVGLRWWNVIDNDGVSHWRFESRQDQSNVNVLESRIFWSSLVACPLLWLVFLMIVFFTFRWSWILVVALGIAMNGANLYGYLRCKYNSKSDVTNFLSTKLLGSLFKPSMLFNRNTASAAATTLTA